MPRNGSGNYSLPTNAWNPAINGVSATPADWQALVNDVAAAIQASVSADGQTPITGNLQMGGHLLTGAGAPSGTGMSLRWEQLTRGADIPSATSITIPLEGQFFAVTGSTAITGFGATIAGRLVYIKFDAGIVLTNSASFILPGGANITTQADDIAVFLSVSIGVWECVSYPRVQIDAMNRLTLDASINRFTLVKTYDGPAITKSGPASASIRAGTYVSVAGAYIPFPTDTAITLPGTMAPGEDYSVWVHPDGTVEAVADPYSSPAAAPVSGAVEIGGFHYSLTAPGTTPATGGFNTASGVTSGGGSMLWTQGDVDKIAGINAFSIWDLAFRCKGEQRGMVFDPIAQCWVAIYFCSTDPDTNGPSRYNTDVASGTVLPKVPAAWGGDGTLTYAALRSWEANEMATAYGLRLIRYEQFMSAAFGVTEGQSLGGATVTIPATARQPGYTSRIGLEQATGHVWVIGGPINSSNGSAFAGAGRGSWYGTTGLVLLGGDRSNAADSGSRAAYFNNALSSSSWNFSVRACGDHLNLGRAAR